MGIIANAYDGSFDSIPFLELMQGQGRPSRNLLAAGSLNSHRNGTFTFIDMGTTTEPFTINVAVEGTQKTALEGKRGVTGNLVFSRGTWNATLLDVLPQPGKNGDLDIYNLALQLFSTSNPSGGPPDNALLSDDGHYILSDDGKYITV